MNPTLIVLLLALVVFQAWVTRKIWQCSAYDQDQKAAQTRFIWLVPLLGAIIAFVIYLDANRPLGGA
jgi:hypothetical protein